MTIVILIAAIGGLAVSTLAARGLIRSGSLRSEPATVVGLLSLTLGGMLYEGGYIGTGRPTQAGLLAVVAIVAIARILSAVSTKRRLSSFGYLLLPALISFAMFATNAVMNPTSQNSEVFGRLIPVFLWIAIAILLSLSELGFRGYLLIFVFSLGVVLTLLPWLAEATRPCDQFKCGPFGSLLTGPFVSENFLAQLTAIGIVFLLWGATGPIKIIGIGVFSLVLYATGSRTSQLALLVALVVMVLATIIRNRRTPSGSVETQQNDRTNLRRMVGLVTVGAAATAGFAILFSSEPSDFSNRGAIWIRGVSALEGHEITGLGLDRWNELQATGFLPMLFPHNQYLILWFGGGMVALALYLLFLLLSVSRTAHSPKRFALALPYAAFLAVLGATEAFWNAATFDGHTFIVLPLLILGQVANAHDPAQRRTELSLGASLPSQKVRK